VPSVDAGDFPGRGRGNVGAMPIQDDNLYGAEHVRAYRETGGERGYLWRNGTEILLLTTRGRSSGQERTTPLIHRRDGDGWVIVASQGGAPDHPSWFKNIQAHPDDVTIQVMDDVIPVRARIAEGEERERLWRAMAEVWPSYDNYATRTDREIPIVVLERR
jgi:deazaflavin-dependent oxidoreductase (nitroreductase family)